MLSSTSQLRASQPWPRTQKSTTPQERSLTNSISSRTTINESPSQRRRTTNTTILQIIHQGHTQQYQNRLSPLPKLPYQARQGLSPMPTKRRPLPKDSRHNLRYPTPTANLRQLYTRPRTARSPPSPRRHTPTPYPRNAPITTQRKRRHNQQLTTR